jgi:hypothetical protein
LKIVFEKEHYQNPNDNQSEEVHTGKLCISGLLLLLVPDDRLHNILEKALQKSLE